MTKLKLSSKMHLFIIISVALAVIGFAVGTVFHFVGGAFFNYGDELKPEYKSVEINYAYVDYSDEADVYQICDGIFGKLGVSYYESVSGDTSEGGKIICKFSHSTDSDKLMQAVTEIETALRGGNDSTLSNASMHSEVSELNGGKVLTYVSIALASAVVLQFLYFLIRYGVTMAFAAALANIHNLTIYTALLALTRVPVGISAVAFGALTVLVTMIACGFLFDRYRRNLKKETFAKLDKDEQTDVCVRESLISMLYPVVGIAAAAVVIFVMLSISAMSALTVLAPVAAALIGVASALYGTLLFTPSVYTRIKLIGDKVAAGSKNKK